MKTSIIIPTYNNLSVLTRCLDSIWRHTTDFTVTVVDNGSSDGTSGYLEQICLDSNVIYFIRNEKNTGFSHAINQGINHTQSDFIVWLNDDTIVTDHWLDNLIKCWKTASTRLGIKRPGIIGPATNSCAGKQSFHSNNITPENLIDYSSHHIIKYADVYEVADFISGFCLFHTRDLISEIGLLDENFGLGGFEDNDFLVRSEALGYRSVIAFDSFVYHVGGSTMLRPEFSSLRGGMSNQVKFLSKYPVKQNQKLVTSFTVKNPPDIFYDSVLQAAMYSDDVCITLDRCTQTDLKHPAFKLLNVHLQTITKSTTEVERRNIALDFVKTFDPDWVMCLDADEILEDKVSYAFMHRLISHPNPSVKFISFPFFTFWNDNQNWRSDSTFGQMFGQRLFKVFPDQFLYSSHPQGYHCSHTPHPTPESTRHAAIKILHYGYVDPVTRAEKYAYYTKTDTAVDPKLVGAEDYSHLISSSVLLHHYEGSKTISFNMLFGGEVIESLQLLDHIYCSVDEIIILSTSNNPVAKFISSAYRSKLILKNFNNNFSDLRNICVENSSGDLILYLDPDEMPPPLFFINLQRIIDEHCDAFIFNFENLHLEGPSTITETVRMFRNDPVFRFKGLVHENLDKALKNPDFTVIEIPWRITHYGYISPNKDINKSIALYEKLSRQSIKKDPSDPLAHFNLAICLQNHGDQQGASDLFRKAAKLDHSYFHPRIQLALIHAQASREWFSQVADIIPETHRLYAHVQNALELLSSLIDSEAEKI